MARYRKTKCEHPDPVFDFWPNRAGNVSYDVTCPRCKALLEHGITEDTDEVVGRFEQKAS